MQNPHLTSMVVAIDFGTSRSGYAYAFKKDRRVVIRTDWPGQPTPYVKTPTHLLYAPDRKVEAWGYDASQRWAHIRQVFEPQGYHFFRDFKMQLREGQPKTPDGPVISSHSLGSKGDFLVLDLIVDYLSELKDLILEEIHTTTSGHLKNKEILWCLTVPAIWTDAEKQLMRRAAQKAGLIGNTPSDAERLLLVLEPEAAAFYCLKHEKAHFKSGTHFMVVDCGGGTVDITVHEVLEDNLFKSIAAGTGGAFGSTYVDRSFQQYLEEKLTPTVIERFREAEPLDYVAMMAEWERAKCSFNPARNRGSTYIPIPGKLYKILLKYPKILESLADEQNGDDGSIHLDSNTLEALFKPTLDGLVETVEKQFQKLETQTCDVLFLVGGFSNSPLLRQRIQDTFASQVKAIVVPSYPASAVVEGAVHFGLKPPLTSRFSRLTYGCSISKPFEPGVDPEEKRYWLASKGCDYCRDRFDVFVPVGTEIKIDEPLSKEYVPINSGQTSMKLQFYATKQKEVRYIDESGVIYLGEVTVAMPDNTGDLNRYVDVTMYFGQTEIKVKAIDRTSGQQQHTQINFSLVDDPYAVIDD